MDKLLTIENASIIFFFLTPVDLLCRLETPLFIWVLRALALYENAPFFFFYRAIMHFDSDRQNYCVKALYGDLIFSHTCHLYCKSWSSSIIFHTDFATGKKPLFSIPVGFSFYSDLMTKNKSLEKDLCKHSFSLGGIILDMR